MTVIEMQVMTIIKDYLPKITRELKRIADSLEMKKEETNG